MTVLRAAVDALPGCRSADGELLTAPFLAACRLVLPVIDSLGPAFLAARSDVSGNIEARGHERVHERATAEAPSARSAWRSAPPRRPRAPATACLILCALR